MGKEIFTILLLIFFLFLTYENNIKQAHEILVFIKDASSEGLGQACAVVRVFTA